MIVGVGIDLVSITRMADKIKDQAFIEKVFSKEEIGYCELTPKKGQHYAVRFAAKEAFLKATGEGLNVSFDLKDIELVKGDLDKPSLQLHHEFEDMRVKQGWQSIHVSVSHEGDNAVAIVIIEK